METKKENSIEHLEGLAIEKINNFLQKPIAELEKKGINELDVVKIAATTRSTNSRLGATKRVKDGTQLAVIKMIATDDKTRKDYIKATLPEYFPKI